MGLFLLLLSVQVTFAAVAVQSCRNETDCLEGYSCIGNICQKCFKCDLLFRKGKPCVIDFNECGDCLEGFEEISITDFSTAIKPCKPVKKKIKFKECTNNSCPPNNYCSEDSCVKCFDCSLVNRLPPLGKCAKGFNECGSCMNGFHDVAVTTDTNFKPCEMNTFFSHETPDLEMYSFAVVAPFCLAFLVFVTAIFFLIMFKKFRDRSESKSTSQDIHMRPSAPPLYALDVPQIFRDCREVGSSFMSFEREKKQQAKVFKQPDALYYWREEEGTDDEARGDQISGNDDDALSRSLDANRCQPEEDGCSRETFTHGFFGLINDSATDSSLQQPNGINAGNNGSAGMDLVSLDIVDTTQVDEDSVNETSDTAPVIQSTEQGEK